MKNSYKLIGAFWDGRPGAKGSDCVIPYDSSYLDLNSRDSLLDLIEKKRSIALSKILAVDAPLAFEAILRDLAGCGSVAIVVDYSPSVASPIHLEFYQHRVSQIMQALEEALPGCSVALMSPPSEGVAA